MTLDLGTLNWLAVIVAAVVYFALGAVWYSPMLFAKPWQASIGWDASRQPPQANPMKMAAPPSRRSRASRAEQMATWLAARSIGSR